MRNDEHGDAQKSSSTRNTRLCALLAVLLTFLVPPMASADDAQQTIVTDRPDFVESSEVVGRGHFQVETSVAVERNNANGIKDRAVTTPTLLRFGISDTVELRLETDGRVVFRTDDAATATRSTQRGYADTSIGMKWHVQDAAGSRPSVGVLAHVDLDSGSSEFRGNGARPSLRVAAEWDLPGEMSLGVMPGLVLDKNAAGQRFTSGVFGIVLGKALNDKVRTFAEIAMSQIARADNGGNVATFDFGLVRMLSDTWQIDTAFAKGLNNNTADWNWTVGLSAKF